MKKTTRLAGEKARKGVHKALGRGGYARVTEIVLKPSKKSARESAPKLRRQEKGK
jgi:hypothetical protein